MFVTMLNKIDCNDYCLYIMIVKELLVMYQLFELQNINIVIENMICVWFDKNL